MPGLFYCKNYDVCRDYTSQPFTLCDACVRAARELQNKIEIEIKPQYVTKNEGLRRHLKAWWKGNGHK